MASSYSPQQTQQSTPGQEEPDHPCDVWPLQHHQVLQIGQNQNHEVPCKILMLKQRLGQTVITRPTTEKKIVIGVEHSITFAN